MESQKVKLRIYGMTCEDCAITISKGLKTQDGVLEAEISLDEGMGKVTINSEKVSDKDLLKNPVLSGKSKYRATIIQ